jgi:hypothetical protein
VIAVYLERVNSDVIGSSVQGEPVVYITAFVMLVLLAFARPLAESFVSLAYSVDSLLRPSCSAVRPVSA